MTKGHTVGITSRPQDYRQKSWWSCPYCTNRDGTPKRTYISKRNAKVALKSIREPWLRVYRCPKSVGYHLGHLPGPVRHGDAARGEVYGDA